MCGGSAACVLPLLEFLPFFPSFHSIHPFACARFPEQHTFIVRATYIHHKRRLYSS